MRTELTTEMWNAVGVLDRAYNYLQEDSGKRDIIWTVDLQDAIQLIHEKSMHLRRRIVRIEKETL